MDQINFEPSNMQVKFRVLRHDGVLLFSSDYYPDAEKFCWNYRGTGEIEIRKVWVRK